MGRRDHFALAGLSLAIALVVSWFLIQSPSDKRVAAINTRESAVRAGTECLDVFLRDLPRQAAERVRTHRILKTAALHVSNAEAVRRFGHDVYEIASLHKVGISLLTPRDRVVVLTPDVPPTPTDECAIGTPPPIAAASQAMPTPVPIAVGGNNGGHIVSYEVQMVGRYEGLLDAIRDLSQGSVLTEVQTPTFKRVDDLDRSRDPVLQATVPVTLYVGDPS